MNPNVFTELVTEDEKALIELLKSHIPSDLKNAPLWQKICALGSITNHNFAHSQLQSLPESFGNLSALTTLDLDNNHLQSLPESFGNLSALTELYLIHNQLQSLPKSFGNLSTLTSLCLYDNQLQSLPESFGNLSALTYLDLHNNNLQKLPPKFETLPLQTLDLCNNPDLANDEKSVRIIRALRQKRCIVLCDQKMENALQKLATSPTSTKEDPLEKLNSTK